MKNLLQLTIILSILVPLSACGKKGELRPPEGYQQSDETDEQDQSLTKS